MVSWPRRPIARACGVSQILTKPCEPEKLLLAVEQTFYIKQTLPDDVIRRVAGAVGSLPCLSQTQAAIERAR